MRIRIDTELCTGHGRCYDVAPELFIDDDEGYGQVIGDGEVAPEDVEAARKAVAACPERAVILE
jgi:ferredoxin